MFRTSLCLLIGAILGLPAPAAAQAPLCADRAEFISALSSKYAEVPVAMGIANNGSSIVEILVSKGGASWTIILSLPDGASCVIAAGENWQSLPSLTQLGPPA